MLRSPFNVSTRSAAWLIATIALSLAMIACTGNQKESKPADAVTESKTQRWPDVLAKVGDHSITRDELLEFMVDGAAQQAKAQPREVVTRSVELMIAERLVTAAAEQEQKTPQEWIQAQVEQRIVEPSRAEVEATYQQFKSQLQGQPLEQAAPSIVEYLKNQQGQAIYTKVIDELRAKTTITMLIE